MEVNEAADLLVNLIGMIEDSHGADYDTALKMGVEALSENGDIIYRQAAVDAIRTKYCPSDFMDDGVIDAFAEIIQDLPSAQPSLDEWCYTCSEYDAERHCCPRWNRVIREAVEEAKEERKTGKWIIEEGTVCFHDVCSECGKKYVHSYPHYNFCPNCGARMQEGMWKENR